MPKMVCNIYTLKKGISVESIIRSILVGKLFTYLLMKMEQTECSETSAYKIQKPGNYPEENIQQFVFTLLLNYTIIPNLFPSVVKRSYWNLTHSILVLCQSKARLEIGLFDA